MRNTIIREIISTLLLGALIIVVYVQNKKSNEFHEAISEYFQTMHKFKQITVQKVATYEDYRNSSIEKKLRTHLLEDHLKVAHAKKFTPIKDEKEISTLAQKGELVSTDGKVEDLFYYYNVPSQYRYLRSFTFEGLKELAQTFQKNLPENENILVKLAISSASRPVNYQKNLRGKNENASFESTHSYGISFDIFYDEFYVTMKTKNSGILTRENFDGNKREVGMVMGGALRRQLQTVLSKTLIEMQDEGKLYAIFEPNQKCYHVTILPQ